MEPSVDDEAAVETTASGDELRDAAPGSRRVCRPAPPLRRSTVSQPDRRSRGPTVPSHRAYQLTTPVTLSPIIDPHALSIAPSLSSSRSIALRETVKVREQSVKSRKVIQLIERVEI